MVVAKNQLLFKPFQWEWAVNMYNYLKKEEVKRYLDLPLFSYQAYTEWLKQIEWLEWIGQAYHRTIWNQNGEMIGGVFLLKIDEDNRVAEMGTWIRKRDWGKGFNQQLKEKALNDTFEEMNIEVVLFFVDQENLRSIKALQKLPYVKEPEVGEYQELLRRKEFKLGKPLRLFQTKRDDFKIISCGINRL
ncbi:GNAT family N-acetyltransferase [Tepidibacillus sp. HK-1]|uniref:GNAT family N-acetyltransferase n=1 Tax=Tepidibacillus sp. HK-1 TaxID=1883407 RepID=UPI0008530DDF|nr:GNAT family N-acetyltransferase [Tepidibacillus sp. HK-1]GBF12264.1 hypothetical protein HK1_02325 [Tepidibacillus sp. HK-1]